jgi:taurine dioxygenase
MLTTTAKVSFTPITPAVGAVIEGIDLSHPLDPDTVAQIREIWLDRGVIFFRGTNFDDDQLEHFLSYFGEPIAEPSAGSYGGDSTRKPVHGGDTAKTKAVSERWHADASWLAEPPVATALRMVKLPDAGGGDTCWSNVTLAYDDLIEPMRNLLDTLTAAHWMAPSLAAMGVQATNGDLQYIHPVVSIHPETGRKSLFVSEAWTRCIMELPPSQSVHLLAMLYDHVRSPLYNMRWRWEVGDVALWDNRAVQHFAVPDYDSGRIIQRAVTAGWSVRGPQD